MFVLKNQVDTLTKTLTNSPSKEPGGSNLLALTKFSFSTFASV
jgi:hypothetical protein